MHKENITGIQKVIILLDQHLEVICSFGMSFLLLILIAEEQTWGVNQTVMHHCMHGRVNNV